MLTGGCPGQTALRATVSTDGGRSWTVSQLVADIAKYDNPNANLRDPQAVSAEVDASGRIYAIIPGCVFRPTCTADDLVLLTSPDGITWDPLRRIPTVPISSRISATGGGIGVDRATSGTTAKLGVFYYYFADGACASPGCQLYVGYISSANGGQTWSSTVTVAGPMAVDDLPNTGLGRMVGDYISTTVDSGTAHSVFPVGRPAAGPVFDLSMYAVTGGLPAAGGVNVAANTPLRTAGSLPNPTLQRHLR